MMGSVIVSSLRFQYRDCHPSYFRAGSGCCFSSLLLFVASTRQPIEPRDVIRRKSQLRNTRHHLHNPYSANGAPSINNHPSSPPLTYRDPLGPDHFQHGQSPARRSIFPDSTRHPPLSLPPRLQPRLHLRSREMALPRHVRRRRLRNQRA